LKRFHVVALILALVFCASCSSLKNTKVTEDNKSTIMSRIGTGNEVTEQERHLLVEYSMRYSMAKILQGGSPDLPTGKTVGQMIEEERKWEAEHPAAQGGSGQPQPGH
jgi:hypothetical protein